MNKHVLKLQNDLQRQFREAGIDYLTTGLKLFHKYRRKASVSHLPVVIPQITDYNNPQAALGNLAISIELMLKAIIAGKNLVLLYKSLTIDVRAFLTSPDELPPSFKWRTYDILLRGDHHKDKKPKTIGFDECVSIFGIFYPEIKKSISSHLKNFSVIRNVSVHSIITDFRKFEVERAAYVAIQIHKALNDTLDTTDVGFFKGVFDFTGYVLSDKDQEFIDSFQKERVARVKKRMEDAVDKAKGLSGERITRSADDWDHYIVRCIICRNDVVVEGYTEKKITDDVWLEFFLTSYRCLDCGLALNDLDELQLAGIPTLIDRSEDIDKYPNAISY